MANKKHKIIGKILTVLILFGLLYSSYQIYQIWNYPENIPMNQNAKFAIVLGATAIGSRPTPVFRERIMEGIRLFESGRVTGIIFTGGPGNPSQAEVATEFARDQGVPPTAILTETYSTNTFENLSHAKNLAPGSSFLIVSDPLHLKRAMKMAQDLEMEAYPAPSRSSAVQSMPSRIKFVLREYLAFNFYRLKKWLGISMGKTEKSQSDNPSGS